MKYSNLNQMLKGWFVGGFTPSVISTNACEVAVKYYKAGDYEGLHFHKIATEITVIVSGRAVMVGREWGAGDIVVLSPGEATDFKVIEDTITVVVKLPGAANDKYIVE